VSDDLGDLLGLADLQQQTDGDVAQVIERLWRKIRAPQATLEEVAHPTLSISAQGHAVLAPEDEVDLAPLASGQAPRNSTGSCAMAR
jgi:hypothetical protein